MSWIERRMADLEAWTTRNATIRDRAVEIYEALWREIVQHVNEAEAKGFPVSTNGAPRDRLISLGKRNKSGQAHELHVILVDAKDRIRVRGDLRIDFSLDLDICPDGVVCLKLAGQLVSIEHAAIAVLDPFLFPQLQSST